MGMAPLRGDETATEIITLAYGMEKGLGEFYETLSKRVDNPKVATLLNKLAKIEEHHKQKLFDLYITFDSAVTNQETFESSAVSEMMEGGFTTEEFLEKNRPVMQTAKDVLNFAMMLETQALDLYLRYSRKAGEQKSMTVLYNIAEEEKTHLTHLGQLMEKTYEEGGSQ